MSKNIIAENNPITVGLWKSKSEWQFVWFDAEKHIHYKTFLKLDLALLTQSISQSLSYEVSLEQCNFVTSILPHQLWQKTLVLPLTMNADEVEQQCRYVLQNDIPVPLEDIWFDFLLTKLNQGVRIDIFAILRKVACHYVEQLEPIPISILDSVTNSLQYGFNYLLTENSIPKELDALYLYQDEDQCIALMEQIHRTLIMERKEEGLVELYHNFCQQYDVKPKNIFVYQSIEGDDIFPTEWQRISTIFPLIALGNALWKRPDFF